MIIGIGIQSRFTDVIRLHTACCFGHRDEMYESKCGACTEEPGRECPGYEAKKTACLSNGPVRCSTCRWFGGREVITIAQREMRPATWRSVDCGRGKGEREADRGEL